VAFIIDKTGCGPSANGCQTEGQSINQSNQSPQRKDSRTDKITRDQGVIWNTVTIQGSSTARRIVAEDQWVHGVRQQPLPLAGTPSAVLRPPSSIDVACPTSVHRASFAYSFVPTTPHPALRHAVAVLRCSPPPPIRCAGRCPPSPPLLRASPRPSALIFAWLSPFLARLTLFLSICSTPGAGWLVFAWRYCRPSCLFPLLHHHAFSPLSASSQPSRSPAVCRPVLSSSPYSLQRLQHGYHEPLRPRPA
jgi:hypothetical protein